MKHPILTGIGAALAATLLSAANAQPATRLQVMNGGIGQDEAARMRAAEPHYSLALQFSERRDNEFVAGAGVKIVDAHGRIVLFRRDAGPILLVNLAPGRYAVSATVDGRTETRTVLVPHTGTERMYFHWGTRA